MPSSNQAGGGAALCPFRQSAAYSLLRAISFLKLLGTLATLIVVLCAVHMCGDGSNPWLVLWVTIGATALAAICLEGGLNHSFNKIEGFCDLALGTKDPRDMKRYSETLYWLLKKPPCWNRSLDAKGALIERVFLVLLWVPQGRTDDDPRHLDCYVELAKSCFDCSCELEVLRSRSGSDMVSIQNNEYRFDQAIRTIKGIIPEFKTGCTWMQKILLNFFVVYGCLLAVVLCLTSQPG